MLSDDAAQDRQCCLSHRVFEPDNLDDGMFRIDHLVPNDGAYLDRHVVVRHRFLRFDVLGNDANVDYLKTINNGNHPREARRSCGLKSSEAKYESSLKLLQHSQTAQRKDYKDG